MTPAEVIANPLHDAGQFHNALQLVDLMCENPIVTSRLVEGRLGVARPTALRLLRQLADARLLEEAAQGPRGQRRYVARDLLDVVTADDLGGAR